MRFRSKFIGITSALTFGIVNTTAVRIMSTFAATFPKPYLAPATKSACADVYIIPMFRFIQIISLSSSLLFFKIFNIKYFPLVTTTATWSLIGAVDLQLRLILQNQIKS